MLVVGDGVGEGSCLRVVVGGGEGSCSLVVVGNGVGEVVAEGVGNGIGEGSCSLVVVVEGVGDRIGDGGGEACCNMVGEGLSGDLGGEVGGLLSVGGGVVLVDFCNVCTIGF